MFFLFSPFLTSGDLSDFVIGPAPDSAGPMQEETISLPHHEADNQPRKSGELWSMAEYEVGVSRNKNVQRLNVRRGQAADFQQFPTPR